MPSENAFQNRDPLSRTVKAIKMQNTPSEKTESKLHLTFKIPRNLLCLYPENRQAATVPPRDLPSDPSVVLDLLQVQLALVQWEEALLPSAVPVTRVPTAPVLTGHRLLRGPQAGAGGMGPGA